MSRRARVYHFERVLWWSIVPHLLIRPLHIRILILFFEREVFALVFTSKLDRVHAAHRISQPDLTLISFESQRLQHLKLAANLST
jgi:hypothetical protein